MNCLQCGKEISYKAKYCSDKCRMAYKRTQPEQPEQNQVEQPEQTQPEQTTRTRPANYGQADCECMHCASNSKQGNKLNINHNVWKPIDKLGNNEVNRVSLPGDADYARTKAYA